MTYKENITAILECHFSGFKQEIIDSACNCILELEPCEYAPFTIDELKDEDMQKLLRGFKNQQVIVTDNDCSPSATIIEPCGDVPDINVGDMISRKAVLDIVRFANKWLFDARSNNVDTDIAFDGIISKIYDLPSVTPKEKTGHWIMLNECANSGYYCSECHKKVIKEGWSGTIKKIKYCPNCGAKMVEPQESEDKE